MNESDKRFGIWYSGLTDTFYAGWAKRLDPERDTWEVIGKKHDVTTDVRRYIDSALLATASDVLDEVRIERRRQISEKGYTAEHDDEHTLAEFAAFIEQRMVELRYGQIETTNPLRAHKLLRETAALAVAALEKLIRAGSIPPGDAK